MKNFYVVGVIDDYLDKFCGEFLEVPTVVTTNSAGYGAPRLSKD